MKSILFKGVVYSCATLFLLTSTACSPEGNSHQELRSSNADVPKMESRDYRIRPLDLIRFEMFAEPENRGEQRVTGDGAITFPLLGHVKISGMTLVGAKQKIEKMYRDSGYYVNPQVSLQIVAYAERRVYITGFVGAPGPVIIPPEEGMTLLRAISLARGLLPRASSRNVILTRSADGEERRWVIDLGEIQEGYSSDIDLQDGDRIYVQDSKI